MKPNALACSLALIFCLALVAPGCSTTIPVSTGPEGVPPGHQKAKQGGPPPWAPAHGYRRKHTYDYYPNREVYFDPAKREYVWFTNGRRHVGFELPEEIRIDLGRPVSVDIEGDDPTVVHGHIKAYYPPGPAAAPEVHPGRGKAKGHHK